MAAQSNPPSFGYTWGFADNSRADSVVEISPNINYTVSEAMPYLQLTDAGSITVQKDVKGAITHTNKGVVRRMFVVNEPFTQASSQSNFRVITTGSAASTIAQHKKQDILTANGILDTKTVLTTGGKTSFVSSPIGTLQLTVEECNEIMMKRAVAAAQQQQQQQQQQQAHHQNQHHTTITTTDGHHTGISVQVQKVIQGLEEADDSQQETHCKLEPNMDIDPKEEVMHQVDDDQEHELELELDPDHEMEAKHDPDAPPKERPYSCEECGKSFLLKHHLTTHARVHTGERPHVCVHCGKSFAHKHCLNTHLLLHSTDRPYQCSECKKSFTLKHHLLTHSRVHSRERPFVCQECGRAFPLKRHLVTHSKFHAGERPYVCEECGESFAQENHLVMHSRFHGSVNPFVCGDCGATFPRKFQLVNHGRIHGRVPHACTVCGKEFLQKRTLVAHMRLMHTGDHAYPCTACGEGFRTKAELNQHNRQTHGGVNPNSANTTIVVASQQQQQQQHQAAQIQVVHTTSESQHIVQHVQQQSQHQQQAQQQQNHHHQQQTVTVVSSQPNNGIVTISTPETSPTRPQYACRECGQAFNSREALALHLRLHTGDKSLMTDLCALTAALPGHFLSTNLQQGTVLTSNHSVVQQTPVPVQIISTGQVIQQGNIVQSSPSQAQTIQVQQVQQQQQQQQHQQQQQQQQPQQQTTIVLPVTPQQKPKTHFCTSCGKGFASKHGLLQHHRRHPNGGCTLRTHVCECGKAFFQKNHLMLHQRQHLETKPVIIQQQQQATQNQSNTQQDTIQQQNVQQQQVVQQQQQQQQLQTQQQAQQQAQNQQNQQQQHTLTREVLIGNQPVHVQVLQGNTAQVIKYEINIPQESGQGIE